ncbi:MAG: class II glutamine amidotransferase [Phycisphaerae bacterium]|nr:class II glutamine amidotransferase [Phycisphaerae bacterium]
MCRWLAYIGSPIQMDDLLLKPEHSMIDQSRHARQSTYEINADGFGAGWYGDSSEPGMYHDIRPIWNDQNFHEIARHVRSHLFMCHIRASSGSAVVRSNCHPYRHGTWLFQHNGEINEFGRIRHALVTKIDPDIFATMRGATDTEVMFQLALTFGLMDDPLEGVRRMIEEVEEQREQHGVEKPFLMTVAVSDGTTLWAFRHASHGTPPSLYHSHSRAALQEASGDRFTLPDDSVIVLSEPLDSVGEHWVEVPASSALVVRPGEARILPLTG